jgi:hypothetical protein
MSKQRQSEIKRLALLLAVAAGSFGGKCNNATVGKESLPCDSGVAQIMFWDGKAQKVCGCGGTDGEFTAPGTALTCTFTLGKTFFVSYQGPFLQHQFVPVGTPALPYGPIFDPNSKNPIRAHGFAPTAAGTYSFRDEYDHSIFGTITVTP